MKNFNFIFLITCPADFNETWYDYSLHQVQLIYAIKSGAVFQTWLPLPWKQKKGVFFKIDFFFAQKFYELHKKQYLEDIKQL